MVHKGGIDKQTNVNGEETGKSDKIKIWADLEIVSRLSTDKCTFKQETELQADRE